MAGILAIMLAAAAFAGSLNPPTGGGPGVSGGPGAMYTLENIYQRLLNGTAGAKRVGPFAEPGASPSATGHTLNDVYNLIGTRAFVPKTGQTACYNDTVSSPCPVDGFPGQDGDKLKGVANPSPRFTAANGTVTDNLTGLIWLQNANCFGTRTWTQALSDANGLASGSCGLTDSSAAGQWRLPNVKELQSLIDFQNVNRALPTGHPFSNVKTDQNYWSATTYASNPDNAWYMYMYYGRVRYYHKSVPYYVWPVRGGQ